MAGSFAAKFLLLLLVISFGVWGVGDMLRTAGSNPTVAKVGSVEISASDFLHALHRESEALRNTMGSDYSPDILKNKMLADWVLKQLVNDALLKQEAENIGLLPDDATVVRHIRADHAFQDEKDHFDKRLFEARLNATGMSEKAYVDKLRENMASDALTETITAIIPVPDIAVKTLLEARGEQRSVTLYRLTTNLITSASKPDEKRILEYYDKHHKEFTQPEYRTLSYVTITSADVHDKDAEVTQDQLRAAYNERIEEFRTPERRTVDQLIFASEDQAKKAREMLASGKSIKDIAKVVPLLNKDTTSMGKVDKKDLADAAVEPVFSLAAGGITAPIQSQFGWHLFRASTIDPPATLSLEEARPTIEKELKQGNAENALPKLTNAVQDALAGGNTLTEAAHDFGLKVISVGAVNREGYSLDGKPNKALPDLERFLETAFKTDEKSESPMVTTQNGGAYVLRVDSVQPEHLQPLDEVKAKVIAGCEKEEKEQKLAELAKTISEKFATPKGRDAILSQYGLTSAAKGTIKRSNRELDKIPLSPSLVSDIFMQKAQQGTHAHPEPDGTFLIAQVDTVIPFVSNPKDPKLTSQLLDIHRSIETPMQNEILDQYAHYLMGKYPVTVNDEVLQAVLK